MYYYQNTISRSTQKGSHCFFSQSSLFPSSSPCPRPHDDCLSLFGSLELDKYSFLFYIYSYNAFRMTEWEQTVYNLTNAEWPQAATKIQIASDGYSTLSFSPLLFKLILFATLFIYLWFLIMKMARFTTSVPLFPRPLLFFSFPLLSRTPSVFVLIL